MSWIRLEDQIAHHPKFVRAGPVAAWLFVGGLSYAARLLTDGFIPSEALSTLAVVPKPERAAAALVAVGLWEIVEGGWQIHDYHTYQPSKDEVEQRRAARSEAGRRGAFARHHAGKVPEPPHTNRNATARTVVVANVCPVPDPVISTPPNPPPGGFADMTERFGIHAEDALLERCGPFWERWRDIFAAHSNGAPYPLTPSPRDYRDCLLLVGRYPDDTHLDRICACFVKARLGAWGESRKSIGWLVRVSPDVDRDLRAAGARPVEATA